MMKMMMRGAGRRVLYLVPHFLQYHTEREGRPKPEGETRDTAEAKTHTSGAPGAYMDQ